MSLSAVSIDNNQIGYFRIFATPPGGDQVEITTFRNAPIVVNSVSTTDPFTDSTANLSLSQITVFDTPGQGDLTWLVPDCDIDIVWQNTSYYDLFWRWEGYIASYDFSLSSGDASFSIDLKGALYALDNYLARPGFPRQPIPYEILIAQDFDPVLHPARLSKLKVTFPDNWATKVPTPSEMLANTELPNSYLAYLRPWGVSTGQNWSGLTSRVTGSWEPLLTGHVQTLLGVMFDEGGSQWTIRNNGFRRPELYLRTVPKSDDPGILNITLGAPGVEFNGSRDFTQSTNVVYGSGTDAAGIQYSGMQIDPHGTTNYTPYAYSPLVYPRTSNPQLNKSLRAKETMMKFQDGLAETDAYRVARAQLQRFADPGVTGTLTLATDPLDGTGKPFPRMLIKAGTTIRLNGLFGNPEGYLVHVTQTNADFSELTNALTVDSKYRDVLTVEEVKARTRDALDPVRALQVGKYQNLVQDLVLPWSYAEGSGVLPSGGALDATEFFNQKLPVTATFPYEEWTTKYPPSKYPQYYVRIGPTDVNDSSNNWAWVPNYDEVTFSKAEKNASTPLNARLPIRVRMSQQGTIRLSQIAAYDKNGNVMKVRFHVSVYLYNGTGPDAMPKFNSDVTGASMADIKFLHPEGITVNYQFGQPNPFFENAFEEWNPDGTQYGNQGQVLAKNANLQVGWGNYYEPAGYSPGRYSRGAARTGLLTDESTWTWNLSNTISLIDPSSNYVDLRKGGDDGMLFVNIYCDEQLDQPVFFMGRFYRQEPGT